MQKTHSTTTEWPANVPSAFKKWERTSEGGFTYDQLIDAYLMGKEYGRTEEIKVLDKTFEANLEKAFSVSEEKFDELRKIFGIQPVAMRMKIQDISSFAILFVLNEKDYKSEKIEDIYNFLIEEMKKLNSDEFSWFFVITPQIGELNEDAISSDGYSLRYGQSKAA